MCPYWLTTSSHQSYLSILSDVYARSHAREPVRALLPAPGVGRMGQCHRSFSNGTTTVVPPDDETTAYPSRPATSVLHVWANAPSSSK